MERTTPASCMLCPRMCAANRRAGQVGVCGSADEVYIARAALHHWEEPPISGVCVVEQKTSAHESRSNMVDGVDTCDDAASVCGDETCAHDGADACDKVSDLGDSEADVREPHNPGSGTIFFTGCSLHCVYCQNAEISGVTEGGKPVHVGKKVSADDIAEICLRLQDEGALNINFVTPTHVSYAILDAIDLARKSGLTLPIVWNTSGYERSEVISELEGYVDIFLTDFKYFSPEIAQKYSHASNYAEVALPSLARMVEIVGTPRFDAYRGNNRMCRGVIVRHMLLPGCSKDSKRILLQLYTTFGDAILYSIMNQYTPFVSPESQIGCTFPELLNAVSDDEYEDVLNYADDIGIADYFWQDGHAASCSFIPHWNMT